MKGYRVFENWVPLETMDKYDGSGNYCGMTKADAKRLELPFLYANFNGELVAVWRTRYGKEGVRIYQKKQT